MDMGNKYRHAIAGKWGERTGFEATTEKQRGRKKGPSGKVTILQKREGRVEVFSKRQEPDLPK